jgi:3-oxoacyl-[acyl-carrier protein] reductase
MFSNNLDGLPASSARRALRGGLVPESAAVIFLASDEARWITGDTPRVDGGSKL